MPDPAPTVEVPSVSEEFEDAVLGDARRTRRLVRLAETAAKAPELSFPKMTRSEGELEGAYRFFANDEVEWQDVLAPHQARTAERCAALSEVLVVHDTTQFRFETDEDARELGLLSGSARGFFGHFALALADKDSRTVLGVLGFQPVIRERFAGSTKEHSKANIARIHESRPQEEKERERWYLGVEAAEAAVAEACSLIHVMDREADAYMLWSRLVEEGRRFVIRATSSANRRNKPSKRVERALRGVEGQLLREIPLKRRPEQLKSSNGKRPARAARLATLHVRAATATLERTAIARGAPQTTTLNVIDVYEPSPPVGQEPIQWQLLTTEPIDTLEQVERVVDIYRARWTIEEYFKALKTGCAYETRQLETLDGLLKALALFIPIAWRLLLLRNAARQTPLAPAAGLLEEDELKLLRKMSVRVKLPAEPTLEQALNAVAGLGGHLKRNGPPGWQTLTAGYRQLRTALVGYLAGRAM